MPQGGKTVSSCEKGYGREGSGGLVGGGRKEKTGRRVVGKQGRNDEKGAFSLPTSSFPPHSLSPSQLECRYITTSLLSPRVLAGGNMNCVLDNMSNRYTRYVYVHVYLLACMCECV